MKKIIITFVSAAVISFIPMLTLGQQTSPSDPGGSPEAGPPLGGSAPVGGGLGILLALGAAYGGKKVYNYFQDEKEELES